MARQGEGLSISRAVELWGQYEARRQDPLICMPLAVKQVSRTSTVPTAGGTVSHLLDQWIESCLAYDEQRAEWILNQAFALYAPETVAIELLQRGVHEIGEGWYAGDVSVQQEHFCSSLVVRRLEALILAIPPATRAGRILVACPPEEHHTISLLLLAYLLRRGGWGVIYLGANVPIAQLENTIVATRPRLVIMSAQTLRTAATLRDVSLFLHQQETPLAYGGYVFNELPTLRGRITGHFLGESIETVPSTIESLLTAPPPLLATEDVSDAYRETLDHFEERLGLIETHVIQTLSQDKLSPDHLALANRELGQNIRSALALGDMNYLDPNVGWLTGLLANHDVSAGALHGYLQAYEQAASQYLDDRGRPVTDWLTSRLNILSHN